MPHRLRLSKTLPRHLLLSNLSQRGRKQGLFDHLAGHIRSPWSSSTRVLGVAYGSTGPDDQGCTTSDAAALRLRQRRAIVDAVRLPLVCTRPGHDDGQRSGLLVLVGDPTTGQVIAGSGGDHAGVIDTHVFFGGRVVHRA